LEPEQYWGQSLLPLVQNQRCFQLANRPVALFSRHHLIELAHAPSGAIETTTLY
jgi:hypothetical protein